MAVFYEDYMICVREFCNVSTGNQVTGFQLKIRTNYYRGTYLSQIDALRLVVDEEEFSNDNMTLTVDGETYTFEQLGKATHKRWFFGDPATLTVAKPGGLKTGMHTVQLGLFNRNSYIPRHDREKLYDMVNIPHGPNGETGYGRTPSPLPLSATKKITLVQ